VGSRSDCYPCLLRISPVFSVSLISWFFFCHFVMAVIHTVKINLVHFFCHQISTELYKVTFFILVLFCYKTKTAALIFKMNMSAYLIKVWQFN
jgi:hypothetical protein